MYKLITDPANQVPGIRADALMVGDLAEVIDGRYQGHIVLQASNVLVSFSDPDKTWTTPCSLLVKKLNRGATVTLTVTD